MPKFHVAKSISIQATPEAVYDTVSDYNTWTSWSPWLPADPDAAVNVTGDGKSVGAVYSWNGNVCGHGEIEHKKLQRPKSVQDEIRFLKPFKSRSDVSFDVQPEGDGTRLTWHMQGSLPWFLFFMKSQMELFIGMDYERGLKMIKAKIENGSVAAKTEVRGVQPAESIHMLGVRKRCPIPDIGPSMGEAFGEVEKLFEAAGLPHEGRAMSVYHCVDFKKQEFDYTSGVVVPEGTATPPGLVSWSHPAGKALVVEHTGTYDHLGNSWYAAYQVTRAKKLKIGKQGTYEIYLNDPESTPEEELRTDIFLPLR